MGLIVDLFAGGGGASTGIEMALGRSPDIAINHDPEALAMHRANHPTTRHLCVSVLKVLPLEATGGAKVDVLHASPDCAHFSKAKGGKPRSQFIRDLAWVVIRWAEDTRPTLISLENVEEFQTWGPLDRSGQPIKEQSGATFRAWVRRLRRLGYRVGWRDLRACDYGAPTTRKRLFVMARRDGKPIVWPRPTHGDPNSEAVRSGKLLPWRTAAECIDWSLPTQSIFARKKPLADNTLRRIAEGIRRYVLQAPAPFLVFYYGAKREKDFRGSGLDVPLRTQTTENRFALVAPTLMVNTSGHAPADVQGPLPTVTTGNHHYITGCLVKYYGQGIGSAVSDPMHTVTSKDRMGFVTAPLTPAPCGMGRYLEVRAFLRERGVIGSDAEAEVIIDGETYRITDICLRMLKPRELYRAQGFADTYIIAPMHEGKPLTITAQVRMCGNSVPPQFVAAPVRANGPDTWAAPKPVRTPPLLHWAGKMTTARPAACFARA